MFQCMIVHGHRDVDLDAKYPLETPLGTVCRNVVTKTDSSVGSANRNSWRKGDVVEDQLFSHETF